MLTFDDNRVLNAIEKKKKEVEARLASGKITQADIDRCNTALNMNLEEYVQFQEVKSIAVASEKLTLDEGMTLYNILGVAGPDKFNREPVWVKAVLTTLFADLLKWKMSLRAA